jgi:hypothetical protein
MISESYLIRASLNSTRAELAEVFPHITDDILDWAPFPGMRTIHGQFIEIIGTEISMIEPLKKLPHRTYQEIEGGLWPINTVAALIAKASEVRYTTLELLTSLDEDGMTAQAIVSEGYSMYLGLEFVPVSEIFRVLIRHESYHTGQLMSYLWAKGNNPYDWD